MFKKGFKIGVSVYNRAMRTIDLMHDQGVVVDKEISREKLNKLLIDEDTKNKEWIAQTGSKFVNSGKYLKPFFDLNGWHYDVNPKTGNPEFSKEKFKDYDINPEFKKYVEWFRRIPNRKSVFQTFCDSEPSPNHNSDKFGVVYPEYKDAITGRYTCSNPNIQNLSKTSGENSQRACIVPYQPDHILIAMDYSQGEYRLFADYCGNPDLIHALNNGADYHQYTADLAGISRTDAKNVNFAMLYGAGDKKLGRMLGVSQFEAKNIREKIMLVLGGQAKIFMEQSKKQRVKKWSQLPLFCLNDYMGTNYLIQGGLADIMRFAMGRITNYLIEHKIYDDFMPYLNIHDEIVFSVNKDMEDFKFYVSEVQEIMERVYCKGNHNYSNGIKMKVDVSLNKDMDKRTLDKDSLTPFEGYSSS